MEDIENTIIEALNDADDKLSKADFERLAESVINYIDEISRSKNSFE